MTIDEALRQTARRLSPCSITARLDAEVLLGHVLGLSRASLLARYSEELGDEQQAAFEWLVQRREQGEPVAYLTGHKEFYGLDLVITPDVLVPRPETESVVEACLEALPGHKPRLFADVGTGSGAILVAVCSKRPMVRAFGTEVSPAAAEVARANCERLGVAWQAAVLDGDLLDPLPGPMDVIAANLPYVPPGEAQPNVATWEPQVSVFGGGDDGTATIRRFLAAAPRYVLPGARIVIETAYSQGAIVTELARESFPDARVEVRKDLAGLDRIVVVDCP